MVVESGCLCMFLVVVVVLSLTLNRSYGLQYMVGETGWSIPPNKDFYVNWSSSRSFHIGDTLVFGFETGLHNVMRVSRREYEACTSDNPFKAFVVGPAMVPLTEKGVFYFICSVSNYCGLGQKLAIVVHKGSPPTPSPSSSSPLMPCLVPISESSVPSENANARPTYSSQASQSITWTVQPQYFFPKALLLFVIEPFLVGLMHCAFGCFIHRCDLVEALCY